MFKTALDVAPEPFSFAPLLIIVLLAAASVLVVLFLLRLLRKGRS